MDPTAVVADEWGLVRHGVRELLTQAGVGVRLSTASATPALGTLTSADLFVAGSFPDMATEVAVRHARTVGAPVIALTARLERDGVLRLCSAGAGAVLARAACEPEIVPAVEHIRRGQRFLGAEVIDAVFSSTIKPRARSTDRTRLSERERTVLEQLATGRSNREIADVLHIGTETVKTHLSNLYVKLGVSRRDQAVAAAVRADLL